MQSIDISDKLYNEIISRRKNNESLSKTLERELKPVKKCDAVIELEKLRKEPRQKLSDVKKEAKKSKALQELDEIKKGKFYTRTQVEKMLAD